MNISIIFALAFLPGVFWLWYFYKKDKFEPEPKRLIVKTFFWGMAGIIPAFIFEIPFSGTGMVLTVIAAPIIDSPGLWGGLSPVGKPLRAPRT